MIKRILVATSLLCMCCILFAQNVQVKGKVVSENEAVEFANVVLQTKDSIFIAGGVTDSILIYGTLSPKDSLLMVCLKNILLSVVPIV